MRRFLTGFVTAAIIAIVPAMALAGNQEIAEQIATRLRTSGQMVNYKIGVKYQDGTAWLKGHVSSPEQEKTALRLVFQTSSVDRVVNDLTIVSSETAESSENEPAQIHEDETNPADVQAAPSGLNPLRGQNASSKKSGLLKRLEGAMARKPKQQEQEEAPQALPVQEDNRPAYADRLSTSYTPSNIETVAAEEPQELPKPTKHASPIARKPLRVAMQPNARGPAAPGAPMPMYSAGANPAGTAPARYDQPCMPNYAWPSYAAYPNYAQVTYPKQYSPTAWPYIGPFYPYPQVPMGWRKVTLEWDSGWWFLDFKDQPASCWQR